MDKPTISDRQRMVDCTIRMGFREDPETFLDKAQMDLLVIKALQLPFKGIREWHTHQDIMLMYTYNNPPTEAISSEVNILSFFLLVRPPMSQSLLIMGWCSSIPEHRLRLHIGSGTIR